ncbi:MAG: hypothetical protein AAB967_01700 [Patescibacteria group bacterium]
MKFTIKTNQPLLGLGRVIGYRLLGSKGDDLNFVRPILRNHYPRFHIYVRNAGGFLMFNLHLDQKKPTYEGHVAHSGEYDGELVEEEAERIRRILEH